MKKKHHSLHHKRVGLYAATLAVAVAIPLIPSIGNDVQSHLTGALVQSDGSFRVSRRSVLSSAEQGTATPNQTQVMRARFYSTTNVPVSNLAKTDLSNRATTAKQTSALKRIGKKQEEQWAILADKKATAAQKAEAQEVLAKISIQLNQFSGPLIKSIDVPKNAMTESQVMEYSRRPPNPGNTGNPNQPSSKGHQHHRGGEGPYGSSTCNDSDDNDENGYTDGADPSCQLPHSGPGVEICGNNIDDDENGLTDAFDPACAGSSHTNASPIGGTSNNYTSPTGGTSNNYTSPTGGTSNNYTSPTGMTSDSVTSPAGTTSTYTTTTITNPTGMNYSAMGASFSY